ncbi:hypothetical protein F4808DRAFT_329889 [Astrocystis sublimbata]|nr:hypothetical protein F4808DRAFT_329889 [Astrocystis sublimbata]
MFLKVVRQAEDSQEYKRHECGWNIFVHSVILALVFCPRHMDTLYEDPTPTFQVRCEPVMTATIQGLFIPTVTSNKELYEAANAKGNLACDISVDSRFSTTSSHSAAEGEHGLNTVHSTRTSKKVDFVIVPDTDGSLRTAINDFIDRDAERWGTAPHVNQTVYQPIRNSPIAVSIETKGPKPSGDSFYQLSIWVTAWHIRLYHLRAHLNHFPPLVTLPMIEINGHDWELWFACDRQTHIDICGPIKIGNTCRIVSTYALIRSLQAIHEWVKTESHAEMRAWFNVGLPSDCSS